MNDRTYTEVSLISFIFCILSFILGMRVEYALSKKPHPTPDNNSVVQLPYPPEEFIEWYIEHKKTCITCQTPVITVNCRDKNLKLDGLYDINWSWNHKYEWWIYDGEPIPGYTWVPSEQKWRKSTKPVDVNS